MTNNDNSSSLYIVQVIEDGESFEYEYSNLHHAREHFDQEQGIAFLLEYNRGNYYFMDNK
jgi:hypothetical protein